MRAPYRVRTGDSSSSAPGVRAARLLGLLILALFLPLGDLRAESPARHDPHDIRIALRARQALVQDAELSRYTICVTVRQGVVTLWGRVPTEALATRAIEAARRGPGVFEVRSSLVIAPVEANRDDTPTLPGAIALPLPTAPPPKRDPRPPGVLAGNSREPQPSLADAAWIGRPEARKEATSPSAALMPPRPIVEKEATTTAVTRLLQSDVRYAGLRVDERDGVVTLSGAVARMEHVMDLAGTISRVPGVKEVVVENVRVTPR